MSWHLILNLIGFVLIFTSIFMLIPAVVSLLYGGEDLTSFLVSFAITFLSGGLLYLSTKGHRKEDVRHRDGFIIVTLSWLAISFFGALPYMLSGGLHSFTDAYFEAMSGFTTTGASVIKDIEALPKGILFWRSLTQWIGGMGIILFAIAILPFLGAGTVHLFRAEVPEITVDKLRPRIINTAKALWYIYVIITVAATLLYMAGGMGIYDALCHSFTTLATGGFSTKNASIAHFESPFIDAVVTIFMFLSGVNYSLYFFVFRGNILMLFKSSEFKFYISVTLLSIALITLNMWGSSYGSFLDSIRYASFQAVSIMTTTGYVTADYERWPFFSQILLVILMFFGSMIGSTGGGMKQVRVLLMLKQAYREIYQLIHPHAMTTLKIDDKVLTKELLGNIWGFLFLFLFIWVVSTLALTALGVDIITSATTAISAMSNVGPALGEAGPTENYSSLPALGKWILISCMLTGRLEIYTVIILFIPHFWKK